MEKSGRVNVRKSSLASRARNLSLQGILNHQTDSSPVCNYLTQIILLLVLSQGFLADSQRFLMSLKRLKFQAVPAALASTRK
jgi:hypothetical protein